MSESLSVSVREIASALTPPPEWDSQYLPGRDRLGRIAHQEFVAENSSCQSEVDVKQIYEGSGGRRLQLHGRIDLLEKSPGDSTSRQKVIEFKTTALSAGMLHIYDIVLPERFALQAQIYAWMLARSNRKSAGATPQDVTCEVVVRNLSDQETRVFPLRWSESSVEGIFEDYLDLIDHHNALNHAMHSRRRQAAKGLRWVFSEYRRGQQDFINVIEDGLARDCDLLLQAPPGFGKTAAVLFPALKSALSAGRQLFFATAKGGGREPVRSTIQAFQRDCPELQAMILSASEEVCPHTISPTGCKDCSYRRMDIDESSRIEFPEGLINLNLITVDELRHHGEASGLCPVDLSFALTSRVDVVIGDYNYVFDPVVRLRQFRFDRGAKDKIAWMLLIDEAHNLFERGRDMFSEELSLSDVSRALDLIELDGWRFSDNVGYHGLLEVLEEIRSAVEACLAESEAGIVITGEIDESVWNDVNEALESSLADFLLETFGRLEPEAESALWTVYSKLRYLAELLKMDRDNYPFFINPEYLSVGITCLDPSEKLGGQMAGFCNAVGFSGTMTPLEFYRTALGFGHRNVVEYDAESIFSKNMQRVILARGIDTRLSARRAESEVIAEILFRFTEVRPGGYLAVFPSYKFIRMVRKHLDAWEIRIVEQKRHMNHAERRRLRKVLDESGQSTLAMVVAGGQFSEAVDYPGDSCIGVAIIGPCLPPPDPFREALRQYWSWRGEDGEVVAYNIPAMQRVVQGAGRLLRTDHDRGIVLLIDDRYVESRFLDLLPSSWREDILHNRGEWEVQALEFWESLQEGENV